MTVITLSETALRKLLEEAKRDEREACREIVELYGRAVFYTAHDAGVVSGIKSAILRALDARA